MNEVRLYVDTFEGFVKDTLRMAEKLDAGDRTVEPASFGFAKAEMLFALLTPKRWELLRALRASGRSSIRALAKALGRDYRGVHADVTALIHAGLIERDDNRLIRVPWSKITAEMDVEAAA
ncbi:transcriptional regulator [Arvimicrobium flavum]|uniref:HVO_A0114 family putative DNA-binding protein n=1 Tax=Arvimicrobium flavum TaxID=3393320 RepID=UPI00237C4375|nr:transcriptional regulator [Mesorhizobium shangrilense]